MRAAVLGAASLAFVWLFLRIFVATPRGVRAPGTAAWAGNQLVENRAACSDPLSRVAVCAHRGNFSELVQGGNVEHAIGALQGLQALWEAGEYAGGASLRGQRGFGLAAAGLLNACGDARDS